MCRFRKHRVYLTFITAVFAVAMLGSCSKIEDVLKGGNPDAFVINEIMPSNHTGITAADGELYDWIEIKNISSSPASIGDFTLRLDKVYEKK
jgi:hypothetical protein